MRLFVDTSAWLALNDRNDQYYSRAVAKSTDIKRHRIELITSEYIIDESITLIRYRVSHQAAVIFGNSLLNSNIVRIEDVSAEYRFKAWEMFKKFEDKELSFTEHHQGRWPNTTMNTGVAAYAMFSLPVSHWQENASSK